MADPAANVHIGPAGWTYDDWKGTVYPLHKGSGFDPLVYLADYFNTIEINSTFYRPPAPNMARSWVRRIDHRKDFKFTCKLYQKFTHERGAIDEADVAAFKSGIQPMADADRLGCILLQFPWSFKFTPEASQYLKHLLRAFGDYPLVVEVRHVSWDNDLVYTFLEQHNVGFCNIDQPRLRAQLRPTERATSRVGYIRLHGQNLENWFREDAGRDERYNYLYSMQELMPWADRVRAVADKTDETYAIANNHFRGQAVVNALQLEFLLSGRKVPTPASLQAVYPDLAAVSSGSPPLPASDQPSLLNP